MRRRKTIGLAVALAVTGSLLPATVALSAERAATSVTIEVLGIGDFAGDLMSPRRICKEYRKVVVFRVRPGDDERIGATLSDGDTSWLLVTDLTEGRYYAKVRPTERCEGAVSPIVTLIT